MTSARALLDRYVTEKAFTQQVVDLARRRGWMAYHTFDSRRSAFGFPDLVLVHPGHPDWPVIVAELKTARGRESAAQRAWLAALDGRQIETRLWRPGDWDEIEGSIR